jgi:sugar/nucleoside kinase (ribokinase family)
MVDIIAVGEMVIDFLPGQETGSYIRNPGGAPANVAIAAARNGLQSGIYCKLGNDDFGTFLVRTLEENSVTLLSPELTDEAITTMAFVSLNEQGDRSFTFARKPGADMLLDKREIKDQELKNCRLVQAGSCSLSAGKSVEATRYIMKRARQLNKLVGFDINYRNLMWNDDKAACTKEVIEILKYVDFLKLSEEEVDMVGGHDNIRSIMDQNDIAVVVLTLGGDGAELFFDGKSFIIHGFEVDQVADTTGAGDAFWGSFLSNLLHQGIATTQQLHVDMLKHAVRYGNVSGSLAVKTKGAIASLPTRAEIEKILENSENGL